MRDPHRRIGIGWPQPRGRGQYLSMASPQRNDAFAPVSAASEPQTRLVGSITPLIDARTARGCSGCRHTWLLARARAGKVPHHRLGHYVRFSAEDLKQWLIENRVEPDPFADRRRRDAS